MTGIDVVLTASPANCSRAPSCSAPVIFYCSQAFDAKPVHAWFQWAKMNSNLQFQFENNVPPADPPRFVARWCQVGPVVAIAGRSAWFVCGNGQRERMVRKIACQALCTGVRKNACQALCTRATEGARCASSLERHRGGSDRPLSGSESLCRVLWQAELEKICPPAHLQGSSGRYRPR